MHISKTRFIVGGALTVLAIILLMALAIPAMAASPRDGDRGTSWGQSNQSETVTQGNVSGYVPGSAGNQNGMVTQGNDNGSANGTQADDNSMAMQENAGRARNGAPNGDRGTRVEGTATGNVTVTPTDGTAEVNLSMPSDEVTVVYSVADDGTNTLECLTVKMARTEDGESGNSPDQSRAKVEGTATGSITVTSADGTAVEFTLSDENVTVVYSPDTNTLERLMVKMSGQMPGVPGAGPDRNGHGPFGPM